MKKYFLILLTVLLLLTGCSNKPTEVFYNGYDFKIGDTVINLDSYSGDSARVLSDDTYTVYEMNMISSKNWWESENNRKHRVKSEFQKKDTDFYYYCENLSTKIICYYVIDKTDTIECICYTNNSTNASLMINNAYDYCKSIVWNKNGCTVNVNDYFKIDNAVIQDNAVTIPGIITVRYTGDESKCPNTTTLMQGEKAITIKTSADYDFNYYYYNGFLIIVKPGTQITDYLRF